MPPKKAKTTIVTEDELVEAVTTRVRDDMRQDLEDRFGHFKRALERIVGPGIAHLPPPEPNQQHQPAQVPSTEEAEGISLNQHQTLPQPGNSQSAFPQIPEQAARSAEQTPFVQRQQQDTYQRMRQPMPAASGINNNSPAWEAWMSTTRLIATYQSAGAAALFNTKAAYDAVIDAQVRHIMENTPHHLKGTVTRGKFPYTYVTRGPEMKKLTVNSVTLAEHIFGIFCMVEDLEVDPAIKPNLISHMREVAEDSCEFELSTNVRRWSEKVFDLIAERRLPDGWNSTTKIQNLRTGMSRAEGARLSFQKDPTNNRRQFNPNHQPDNLRGGPPCQDFNTSNGCHQQSGHMLHRKRQMHVCAYCLANTANAHPHSEAHCRTKQKHAAHHF